MSAQLKRLILFCKDTNQLKTFYQQYFGLELVEEIKNEWVVLGAGPVELALHKIGEAFPEENEKRITAYSNTKIVFEIREDLHAFRESLIRQGILLKDLTSFPGTNYLVCDGEDPEGNVFQLTQQL